MTWCPLQWQHAKYNDTMLTNIKSKSKYIDIRREHNDIMYMYIFSILEWNDRMLSIIILYDGWTKEILNIIVKCKS